MELANEVTKAAMAAAKDILRELGHADTEMLLALAFSRGSCWAAEHINAHVEALRTIQKARA